MSVAAVLLCIESHLKSCIQVESCYASDNKSVSQERVLFNLISNLGIVSEGKLKSSKARSSRVMHGHWQTTKRVPPTHTTNNP